MRELKFLNVGYDTEALKNDINNYLMDNSSNICGFNNEQELLDLITKKNINLLITRYNFEALKKVRQINNQVQIVAVMDELKKEYLHQSLELEQIKLLHNLNCKNELECVIRECVQQLDSNRSNIVKLKNGFIYDSYNKTLFKKDKLISLSNKELLFLDLLIKNPYRAIDYKEIEEAVWDGKMSQDALRSVVKELRKKVYKELVKNVSGVGYRLDSF